MAQSADLEDVVSLLRASDLPRDGVAEHLRNFLLAYDGCRLVGSAGLELYADVALLRSVAVSVGERGKGLGQELVRRALDPAQQRGMRKVLLLTTTASEFFMRFGFVVIDRQCVPHAVTASVEFSGACPDTAIVMQWVLSSTEE